MGKSCGDGCRGCRRRTKIGTKNKEEREEKRIGEMSFVRMDTGCLVEMEGRKRPKSSSEVEAQ